jgi:hypothetical protein
LIRWLRRWLWLVSYLFRCFLRCLVENGLVPQIIEIVGVVEHDVFRHGNCLERCYVTLLDILK